jgi:hypothetical protein
MTLLMFGMAMKVIGLSYRASMQEQGHPDDRSADVDDLLACETPTRDELIALL